MKKFLLFISILSGLNIYAQQRNPQLDTLLKITDSVILQSKVKALENGNEQDLQSLATFYNIRRKWDQSQAVYEIAAKRYPTSELAFNAASGIIRKEPDAAKRKQMFVQLKNKFAALSKSVDFQMMTTGLAQKSVEDNNMEDALFYIESIQLGSMYAAVARGIYATDTAKGISLIKKYIQNNPSATDIAVTNTYINMMVAGGNFKEAAPYAKEAYAKSKKNAEFINDYLKIMQSENDYPQMIQVLETAVLDGLGSANIKKGLITAYQKQGKDSESSFKLLMEKYRLALREDLVKKMINKPSPAFVLKDIEGKNVSLNDFKGKTIVLDFWATWCVPCKKSFPAMQMAVDKYKDDNTVKFLFIHTWDRGTKTPLKDAADYLSSNKYSFDLYMDYKDPGTEKHPTVSSFNVTGIPTKFVIDSNGNIRFKVDGFYGVDEAAAEEVVAMVELVKADKK